MQKKLCSVLLTMAVLGVATLAGAADAPQGTRITDPAVLASMGFGPDAIVYQAPGAGSDAAPAPEGWGITSSSQVSHPGNEFRGRISTYAYDTGVGARDASYVSGDTFVDAAVNLPSGALWESTRFWLSDNTAQDIGLFLFQSCLPASGAGASAQLQLGTGSSTGTGGFQSVVVTVAPATTIDNNTCIYWARVRYGAAGHIVQKARSQYRLQISPAPAVASFPIDVPTTHPFFRFVEAMAASGLTGGCGGGSFCPDQPVTRGQLSVFLASALGLHFPN